MPDLATALARMRAICADLGDVTEGSHFTSRAFSVGGKMFASCGPQGIVFQLEPDHTDALRATNPKFTAYPRLAAATMIQLADATDWDLLRDLIGESYRLRVAPRKKKAVRKPAAARRAAKRKAAQNARTRR
jgi:hypothetical protein